jgi:hypothetical protein
LQGVITVQDGRTLEDELEVVEGAPLARAWALLECGCCALLLMTMMVLTRTRAAALQA